MAHGRFDKPPETMEIGGNGESVEACGPLHWDGDERDDGGPAQSVTIHKVEVRQGGTHATSKDLHTLIDRGPADWMVPNIPVEGSGTFEDGPAHAEAHVEVVLETGQKRQEKWAEDVELSH